MALIPQRGTPTPHFKPAGANEADTFLPGQRIGTQGDRKASDLTKGPVFAAPHAPRGPSGPREPQAAQRMKLLALLHLMLSAVPPHGIPAAPPGAVPVSPPVVR